MLQRTEYSSHVIEGDTSNHIELYIRKQITSVHDLDMGSSLFRPVSLPEIWS